MSPALQADSLPVDCLIRYAMQAHLISGDKSDLQLMKSCFPFPAIQEGNTFTKGNLCPVFRQKEEGRVLPLSAASQLPAIHNNPHEK